MTSGKIYDCLIVGGGAAGLNAALGLGRIRRSCIIFSHQKHRNEGAHQIHAVLGCDHFQRQAFYDQGRRQIERYQNTEFIETEITDIVRRAYNGRVDLVARNAKGDSWQGRSLVLATGVQDVLPDLEGYAENWPENIYHCLFCDGYERRELSKGVLCYPSFEPWMAQMASMAHHLSDPAPLEASSPASFRSKVTVFTNGPPNPESNPDILHALNTCAAHRMHIDTRRIVRLVADTEKVGVYVHLANHDGTHSVAHVGFLYHRPAVKLPANNLMSKLGIELSPTGRAKTHPPFQSTNIPGVFVAGDASTEVTHVTNAMYTGMMCAAGVGHYCGDLDDQVALEWLGHATSGSV